ncbi:MAG: DUF2341 domain-containing protein [Kofleriaceae bacterium]|nr:DUF2341 domain-containing protein [Kofleriaceae bacterium]
MLPARGRLGSFTLVVAALAACAEAKLAQDGDAGGDGDGGGDVDAPIVEPRCGDGNVDPGEACDDGNQVDTDACTSACQGWRYRVPVTFTAAAAATGVPVLIVLDGASFAYDHAAADGSDLRADADDDPASGFGLPLWLERWTPTGASYLWVRVPAVSAGANTIWLYYGWSGDALPSTSDFAATFPDTLRTTGNLSLGGTVSHDAVVIEAGHTVTVAPGAPLVITAPYVRIDGAIAADHAGYAGGAGPAPGGTSTTAGAGGGGPRRRAVAAAASTAATAWAPAASPAATCRPSRSRWAQAAAPPTARRWRAAAGRGAGRRSRRVVLAGTIGARGGVGGSSAGAPGGGAAAAASWCGRRRSSSPARSPSTAVAPAAAARSTANDGGGGGGGGRIKLLHGGALVATGTTTVTGGAGGLYGDAGNGQPGSPGTFYTGTSSSLAPLPSIGAEETP